MLQTGNGTHQQKEELHEKLLTRTIMRFGTHPKKKQFLTIWEYFGVFYFLIVYESIY